MDTFTPREFPTRARRALDADPSAVVEWIAPAPAHTLPMIVRPRLGDVQLAAWSATCRDLIDARLRQHGALLFRGFPVDRASAFSDFVRASSETVVEYDEPTTPRTRVSGADRIYTSTDYPPEERILPHNERSYSRTVPLKLYFWCETPAREGGGTPIGDVRRVLARVTPCVRRAFTARGWRYTRTFYPGLGLSWQRVFQTEDKAVAEAACEANDITCVWNGDVLTTTQVRAAVETHPITQEAVWFNHAAFFHHTSAPEALRASAAAGALQANQTCYGDGEPIPDAVIEHLHFAYASEMSTVAWERGDVLLLDNMLACHARQSFAGPRRILVSMADPYTRPSFSANTGQAAPTSRF
jgi:alpha-ketoglutarate-dependent taurine dioxygenase